jgi:hypothetical protein
MSGDTTSVMAGLVPAIHVFWLAEVFKRWMPATGERSDAVLPNGYARA